MILEVRPSAGRQNYRPTNRMAVLRGFTVLGIYSLLKLMSKRVCRPHIQHFLSRNVESVAMAPILLDRPDRLSSTSTLSWRQDLSSKLHELPHQFLQPTPLVNDIAIQAAKACLEPLAVQTSDLQHQRQHALRQTRKRKRGQSSAKKEEKPLALTTISTAGFEMEQIWSQAKRVLDATIAEIRLTEVEKGQNTEYSGPDTHQTIDRTRNGLPDSKNGMQPRNSLPFHRENEGLDNSEVLSEGSSVSARDEDVEDGFLGPKLGYEEEEIEGEMLDDLYSEELDDDNVDSEDGSDGRQEYVPDRLGLNDGFFSIDDFNKQSEFLERRDARGEDDGAASDEEDVDWDIDPLAAGLKADGPPSGDPVDDISSVEEGGPTFGDADLNAADSGEGNMSDVEDGIESALDIQNTNDVMYADFFAPPPRKLTKSVRMRALPKTQPPAESQAPNISDMERAMADVRRDIFEDDLEPDPSLDGSEDQNQPRSSHQKRQAELTAEIRRLEAEAVAKKSWTLAGEARAGDRPLNSLLEEDLEFERAGKPVPVITQEVSEDIEALIKRRIINKEFDEVIRRRPGAINTSNGKDVRRGRIELEDGKPSQSLAELYEADHLRETDPGYVDKRSESLKKEHKKIEEAWKDVSAKLDALSNLHFRPKLPEMNVNVVSDLPTIMMEDARPNAGADVGVSMLAPQEIYKAGEQRDKRTEVATRGGLTVGREEMSKEDKIRRRRREKERIKKSSAPPLQNGDPQKSKNKEQKNQVASDLKKGGVRVIGKKGEIRDVDGKEIRNRGASRGAGAYKL